MILAGLLCLGGGIWAGLTLTGPASAGFSLDQPEAAATQVPHPSFDPLQGDVDDLLRTAGATGGVTLTELGGPSPQTWSDGGTTSFTAASTYKLPLLMMEAQNEASGRWHARDSLCFIASDAEDGYFDDYEPGTCLTRSRLMQRVGEYSDNTAAHILVRYAGGSSALNAYAQAHGAQSSAFFVPNTTTSDDLARLWANEYAGHAGGRAAQQILYPFLTHTAYEDGIPAGVPSSATVVHKIGDVDQEVNDAALVEHGPKGDYVLVICTQGTPGDPGWALLASISRTVWQYEATR